MENVTVIIPIGEKLKKADIGLLKKAYGSAEGKCSEIIIIGRPDAISSLKNEKIAAKFVENETPSFASNVNKAVQECTTEYFSILEYDDEYTALWFSNVEKYLNYGGDEKAAILPLAELVNDEDEEIIGYSNEAFWASSFSEEIGYLDIESLENYYFGFLASGGVFKKKDFLAVGGLKESMKLVFWYEFLLRTLYKKKKVFVAPKVGYLHRVNRKDSLSSFYSKSMDEAEAEWWIETAGKEYFFPQDRNKVYTKE